MPAVRDLKPKMLDIEVCSRAGILRLNQDVCAESVCHRLSSRPLRCIAGYLKTGQTGTEADMVSYRLFLGG
jgi:hypothetical protein